MFGLFPEVKLRFRQMVTTPVPKFSYGAWERVVSTSQARARARVEVDKQSISG